MTQRDKRLIVMLSLIVIIVGFGWWGIRPSIKNAKAYEKDYTKEKDLQEINEMADIINEVNMRTILSREINDAVSRIHSVSKVLSE